MQFQGLKENWLLSRAMVARKLCETPHNNPFHHVTSDWDWLWAFIHVTWQQRAHEHRLLSSTSTAHPFRLRLSQCIRELLDRFDGRYRSTLPYFQVLPFMSRQVTHGPVIIDRIRSPEGPQKK